METIELSNFRSIRSSEMSPQELTSQRSRTSHGLGKKIMMISVLTLLLLVVLFIGVNGLLKIYPTSWNNAFSTGNWHKRVTGRNLIHFHVANNLILWFITYEFKPIHSHRFDRKSILPRICTWYRWLQI